MLVFNTGDPRTRAATRIPFITRVAAFIPLCAWKLCGRSGFCIGKTVNSAYFNIAGFTPGCSLLNYTLSANHNRLGLRLRRRTDQADDRAAVVSVG